MPNEGPLIQMFEPHPLAALFPLTEGPRFAELCADIKANGLIHPIVMHEGKILDGRNRLRACKEVGREPIFRGFVALGLACTVEQYIWSANAQRRDLTPDQRAAISTQYSEHIRAIKAAAKERQKAAGKSGSKGGRGKKKKTVGAESPAGFTDRHATRRKQAEEAGVSEHKVRLAAEVEKSRPDLIPKVAAGELKLADAVKQMPKFRRTPKPKQAAKVEQVQEIPPAPGNGFLLLDHLERFADLLSNFDLAAAVSSASEDERKQTIEKLNVIDERLRELHRLTAPPVTEPDEMMRRRLDHERVTKAKLDALDKRAEKAAASDVSDTDTAGGRQ